VTETNARLEFTRSTDGGRTFEPARTVDTAGGGQQANFASPMLAAGANATVHIVYGVWPPLPAGFLRPEFPAPIRFVTSANRGGTWAVPVELGVAAMEVRVTPDTNVPALPTVAAHREQPFVGVAFAVRQRGSAVTDIAVRISPDNGTTWSKARIVPRAGNDISYTQPQLAVDEAGRLALSAFAHRSNRSGPSRQAERTGADHQIDVVLLRAKAFTDQFTAPQVITSHAFNPGDGGGEGKHGAWWIGDYQGLAPASGMVYPFWNDTRTGRLEIFTQLYPAG
jgi:hypothetical protein